MQYNPGYYQFIRVPNGGTVAVTRYKTREGLKNYIKRAYKNLGSHQFFIDFYQDEDKKYGRPDATQTFEILPRLSNHITVLDIDLSRHWSK